jgi:hypothetical protein
MNRPLTFSDRIKAAVICVVVFILALADVQTSFAGCGAGCNHRRERSVCVDALNQKGIKKGPERKAEFDKCMSDPISYK